MITLKIIPILPLSPGGLRPGRASGSERRGRGEGEHAMSTPISIHPHQRLCYNEGNAMFVILNPSPCVTLSEAKGLAFWLRVNSVKLVLSEAK